MMLIDIISRQLTWDNMTPTLGSLDDLITFSTSPTLRAETEAHGVFNTSSASAFAVMRCGKRPDAINSEDMTLLSYYMTEILPARFPFMDSVNIAIFCEHISNPQEVARACLHTVILAYSKTIQAQGLDRLGLRVPADDCRKAIEVTNNVIHLLENSTTEPAFNNESEISNAGQEELTFALSQLLLLQVNTVAFYLIDTHLTSGAGRDWNC